MRQKIRHKMSFLNEVILESIKQHQSWKAGDKCIFQIGVLIDRVYYYTNLAKRGRTKRGDALTEGVRYRQRAQIDINIFVSCFQGITLSQDLNRSICVGFILVLFQVPPF